MSYVESNLVPGEEVVSRTHLHWIILFKPVLLTAAVMAVVGAIVAVVTKGELVVWIPLLAIVGAVLAGVIGWGIVRSSEFALTDKRVLIKVGIIQRKSVELILNKIEAIRVDQSIPGRMLNFGTLDITGTGGTREVFPNIARPVEFRNRVQVQIAQGSGQGS
jgi:uncharacterized membrane protein YdbT with pleckstrin-like domain